MAASRLIHGQSTRDARDAFRNAVSGEILSDAV